MTTLKLTWRIPLGGGEIKIANQRLNRLHVELDRWHREHSPDERIIQLLQTQPYTYQCDLDEDEDSTVLFLTTWKGPSYTVGS